MTGPEAWATLGELVLCVLGWSAVAVGADILVCRLIWGRRERHRPDD